MLNDDDDDDDDDFTNHQSINIPKIFLTFPAEAIARARHEPDLVAVRRLEALLSWQVELGTKSAASELGVLPFLEQMLKE